MNKIKIIASPSKQNPFVIIEKPAGLPSAPLFAIDEENALIQTANIFPEIKNVTGKKSIEYGLLHRLDTATSGLLLIATSQEFYDFMASEQANGNFIKTYSAHCKISKENAKKLDGFPPITEEVISNVGTILKTDFRAESYFRNYGKKASQVRPVTQNSGEAAIKKLGSAKIYKTQIKILTNTQTEAFAKCQITAGYRHQVRSHLAWYGLPVIGDSLYNFEDSKKTPKDLNLEFRATGLTFKNPYTQKTESFFID